MTVRIQPLSLFDQNIQLKTKTKLFLERARLKTNGFSCKLLNTSKLRRNWLVKNKVTEKGICILNQKPTDGMCSRKDVIHSDVHNQSETAVVTSLLPDYDELQESASLFQNNPRRSVSTTNPFYASTVFPSSKLSLFLLILS